ncbi:unnamed protein product [Lactuca saligna]|uniref:Leucine-rich repeat-containing N-terminal plant-type domain-containing protein n=1 Tax=Lactuca saligna TaxID=75948 RepID=A0AA35ZWF9_LACSI|nr:unnamed protein product [Lactuca saligna]
MRGLGLHLIFVCGFLFAGATYTSTCLGDGNTSFTICSEKERLALLKFKDSVEDLSGMLSSWVGIDCCMWEGIHCDGITGKVESLHLRGDYYDWVEGYNNYLVSNEVDSSLEDLRHLKYLDLSGNDFQGSRIPKFIRSFKQLSYLNLSHAGFEGIIPPHIGNLSNLKLLDLSWNEKLMADDMEWTFGLSLLKHLDLSLVDLGGAQNRGMLFYMIPSLKELSLSHCGLSNADLRPSLNSSRIRSNIKHLDLGFNSFGGPLPGFFQNMSSLTFLDLSSFNVSLAWNFANLLSMIPSLAELRLSDCGSIRRIYLPLMLIILHFSHNMLSSPVPVIPNLVGLYISHNWLTGPIPTFLGNLSKLDLSFNQLNGSIPEFVGNLAALTHLDLSVNWLTGPIPTSLGKLVSLQLVSLNSNLLNGTIPVSIGRIAKLQTLDLSNNSLEGVVSEAHFANLSMLRFLDDSYNTKLTFNVSRDWIPPFQLVSLDLSSCNIANGFPQRLQNQRKLYKLVLSNASILGPLPRWLRRMPIILHFDLSHNQLIGPLTNLPSGETYGGRTDLVFLDLSENRLTGKIPKCLENLRGLFTMILSSNRLSGVIPSSVALNLLRRLKLNDNNFVGELPRELRNLRYLCILDVGNNRLSGNLPEWVRKELRYLAVLRLHKNNFTGRIPQSFCKASNLRILDVADNNLKGTIPPCLGELIAMVSGRRYRPFEHPSFNSDENVQQVMKGVDIEYTRTWYMVYNMDLSSNRLVGEIPVELTALSMLVGLNLSNNHLSGRIPDTIGNMSELNSLDLSGNELTGVIPPSMADLTFLSHLNLSHNNLSGRIPTGSQLQTLTDSSIYEGNKDLCGPPLPKNCINPGEDPTTITSTSEKKDEAADEKTKVWLFYVDIICGFATGFWGVIGVLLLKRQWRHKVFMFAEESMDKIYVAVVVKVNKIKRRRETA